MVHFALDYNGVGARPSSFGKWPLFPRLVVVAQARKYGSLLYTQNPATKYPSIAFLLALRLRKEARGLPPGMHRPIGVDRLERYPQMLMLFATFELTALD